MHDGHRWGLRCARSIALLIVVGALHVSSAHALCAPVPTTLAPSSGALPANPTLYLFARTYDWDRDAAIRIQQDGRAVRFTTTPLRVRDDYTTLRIDVETAGEGALVVDYPGDGRRARATFAITPRFTPEATVTSITSERVDEGECGVMGATVVHVAGNAAAFRVSTLGRNVIWIPRGVYFGADGVALAADLGCFGPTLPADPWTSQIVALFPDGTERTLEFSAVGLRLASWRWAARAGVLGMLAILGALVWRRRRRAIAVR